MSITEAFALYDSLILHKRKLKTRTNYRTSYRSLFAAVGDTPIELISEETIIVWRQHMTHEGCSGTTQRGYIGDLRSVMKYFARKRGMNLYQIDRDELPKSDTAPRTAINAQKVSDLISAAKNPRDKAILACVFLSGCRVSEILDLDRGDIDRPVDEQGRMEIDVCGKRDKYRPAYLNATALHYLYAYLETRADRYKPLFISGQNRRITVSRVEQIVHQCARDAGLQEVVTPHVLRHSFTTDLLNNGASLYEVSKLLGHANIATTANIYGHFDTQARKQVLATKQSPISIS